MQPIATLGDKSLKCRHYPVAFLLEGCSFVTFYYYYYCLLLLLLIIIIVFYYYGFIIIIDSSLFIGAIGGADNFPLFVFIIIVFDNVEVLRSAA